jgi:hypothetical protein
LRMMRSKTAMNIVRYQSETATIAVWRRDANGYVRQNALAAVVRGQHHDLASLTRPDINSG